MRIVGIHSEESVLEISLVRDVPTVLEEIRRRFLVLPVFLL